MNDTNRLTSINNTNKVEYTYNHPIASSDLNETQLIISSKIASLNGLAGTGVQLHWSRVDKQTIRITDLFVNFKSNDANENFQVSLPSLNIDVKSTFYNSNLSDKSFILKMYYRLREVNSKSILYKNGIRDAFRTVRNITPSDKDSSSQITNNIFDPNLQEEVSTRIVIELTFILEQMYTSSLDQQEPNTVLTDAPWIRFYPMSTIDSAARTAADIDLENQSEGFIGFKDYTGPKVYDFAVISNVNLLPTNKIAYDQYALVLNSRQLLKKPANSTLWYVQKSIPSLFNSGSFVRINKFLDGTSIYDENCVDQAGYVVFDTSMDYRIMLDYGTNGADSDSIVYTEYVVTKNSDGSESVKSVKHPILAPTFFSEDPVSSAMYNDPDGNYLLSATFDNEIYFRDLSKIM